MTVSRRRRDGADHPSSGWCGRGRAPRIGSREQVRLRIVSEVERATGGRVEIGGFRIRLGAPWMRKSSRLCCTARNLPGRATPLQSPVSPSGVAGGLLARPDVNIDSR